MHESHENFGTPNPNAPAALSQFAFLIGRWRCEATITLANGESQKYQAAWIGRYILDGYVIADEYGMAIPAGETIVLGMNFRAYDSARQHWNIKWLNALTGTWTDLGPEELGGRRPLRRPVHHLRLQRTASRTRLHPRQLHQHL